MPPSKTEDALPGDFRLFPDERERARIPSRVTAVESFIEVCAFITVSCHLAVKWGGCRLSLLECLHYILTGKLRAFSLLNTLKSLLGTKRGL